MGCNVHDGLDSQRGGYYTLYPYIPTTTIYVWSLYYCICEDASLMSRMYGNNTYKHAPVVVIVFYVYKG